MARESSSSPRGLLKWARYSCLLLAMLLLGSAKETTSITLPLTGGTNTDPNMVANPRVNLALFSSASSLVRTMADIHDRFGAYLASRSLSIGCEAAALAAVIHVESGGRGFSGSRMIIRFENHVFKPRLANDALFDNHYRFNPTTRFLDHEFRASTADAFAPFHGNQDKEWTVLQFSQGLNDLKALESASYGAPQIMGFNAQSIGYTNARAMFLDFSNSLEAQMDGMVAFIQGRSNCLTGLRTNDFVLFASCYNGNGQAATYGANILGARNAYLTMLNTLGQPQAVPCTYEGLSGQCSTTCTGSNVFGYTDAECTGTGNECCAPAQSCSPSAGVTGSCLDVAECSDGQVFSGLCPGSAAIKCCVRSAPVPATSSPTRLPTIAPTRLPTETPTRLPTFVPTRQPTIAPTRQPTTKAPTTCTIDGGLNVGTCKDVATCGSGFGAFPGFCPGAVNIQCCASVPLKTRAPTRLPTQAPTTTCTYEGLSGYCSSSQTCSRQVDFRGYAVASPAGCQFCCVPAPSCSTGGTCLDTAVCPVGSAILSGLCPGSAKIKCCVANGSTSLQADTTAAEQSSSGVAAGVAIPVVALASASVFLLYRRRKSQIARELTERGSNGRWSVAVHRDQNGQPVASMSGDNPLFSGTGGQNIRV